MLQFMLTGTCWPPYQLPKQRPPCPPATCSQVRCVVSSFVWVWGLQLSQVTGTKRKTRKRKEKDANIAGFFVSSVCLPPSCSLLKGFWTVPFEPSSCPLRASELLPLHASLSQLLQDHHPIAARLLDLSVGTKQVPLSFPTSPALDGRLRRLSFLIGKGTHFLSTFSFFWHHLVLSVQGGSAS